MPEEKEEEEEDFKLSGVREGTKILLADTVDLVALLLIMPM